MHNTVSYNNQSVNINNIRPELIETNNNRFHAITYIKQNSRSFFGWAIALTISGWGVGHLAGGLVYNKTHPELHTPNGDLITTNKEKIYQAVGEAVGAIVFALGASLGRLACCKLKERCCYLVRATNNIENTPIIDSNNNIAYV